MTNNEQLAKFEAWFSLRYGKSPTLDLTRYQHAKAGWQACHAAMQPTGKASIAYEVWQDDFCQASADSLADAQHYMLMYGQDGPVELRKITSYSEVIDTHLAQQPDLAAIREVIAWHQAQASTIRSGEHYDEIIGERLALKHDKQAGKLARAIEKTP